MEYKFQEFAPIPRLSSDPRHNFLIFWGGRGGGKEIWVCSNVLVMWRARYFPLKYRRENSIEYLSSNWENSVVVKKVNHVAKFNLQPINTWVSTRHWLYALTVPNSRIAYGWADAFPSRWRHSSWPKLTQYRNQILSSAACALYVPTVYLWTPLAPSAP